MRLIKKLLLVVMILGLSANCMHARVRVTDELQKFVGTWTHVDELGNVSKYQFSVSDGWLILREKYEHNYGEHFIRQPKNIDYKYDDGVFYFNEDYPEVPTYNSVMLTLEEGSLIKYIKQKTYHDGSWHYYNYTYAYEMDF